MLESLPNILGDPETFWNGKDTKALIILKKRFHPLTNHLLELDIRLLVTVVDGIIDQDLKKNNITNQSPGLYNVHAMNVYKHTRLKTINPYNYELDERAFGTTDLWSYPYELRVMAKGDCDDWAVELATYLIMSGLPSFRVRCVGGITHNNNHHLTTYVLDDSLKVWRHLNSTSPITDIQAYQSIDELPAFGDESDIWGIKRVWFSFNNQLAWYDFATAGPEEKPSWVANLDINFLH